MSTLITDSDIALIRAAYNDRNKLPDARDAVERALEALDSGVIRVAEQTTEGDWQVNAWVKEAILCFFRLSSGLKKWKRVRSTLAAHPKSKK